MTLVQIDMYVAFNVLLLEQCDRVVTMELTQHMTFGFSSAGGSFIAATSLVHL